VKKRCQVDALGEAPPFHATTRTESGLAPTRGNVLGCGKKKSVQSPWCPSGECTGPESSEIPGCPEHKTIKRAKYETSTNHRAGFAGPEAEILSIRKCCPFS
jgi:hypothetical protein